MYGYKGGTRGSNFCDFLFSHFQSGAAFSLEGCTAVPVLIGYIQISTAGFDWLN